MGCHCMTKFNPFRPNSPVRPGMFAGRYDEVRRTEQGLFQTKKGNPYHFLFEGERGIGKTSLFFLLTIMARGEISALEDQEKFNFIVVPVELREAMEYQDILTCIIVELRRQIGGREKLKEAAKRAWEFLSRFEVWGVSYRQDTAEQERSDRLDSLTN